MEANWDEQMLWRCAEDGDELVIPDCIKSLDHGVDRDVYFRDMMMPESGEDVVVEDPESGEDVVVENREEFGVVEDPPSLKILNKKVDKHPDDALFQQQLGDAQVQHTRQRHFSHRAMFTAAKKLVGKILCRKTADWKELRRMCLAANDRDLYDRSIEAAAYLIFKIYNKVSLFRYANDRLLNKQMDALHKQVLAQEGLKNKACSDYEVGKLIVQLTADLDKYSFLTEGNLAEMLTYFPSKVLPIRIAAKYEDQILGDIDKVLGAMKESSLPRSKADDQTRLLITFLKKESHENIHGLACDAMLRVKPDAVERLDKGDAIFECLWVLLLGLAACTRLWLQGHLSRVTEALFELHDPGCYVFCEIIDIVEVAELRRMALGTRFIRRSYLIWAFYELGYGVPPKIRNAIEIPDLEKDVPPYHIYMVAAKLAVSSGKNMHLEHFLYAVIFAKEDIDLEGEEWDEMVAHFNDFVADLESSQE